MVQVWGAVSVEDSIALWRATPADEWAEAPFVASGSRRAMSNGALVEGRLIGGLGVWGGESPFNPETLSGYIRI